MMYEYWLSSIIELSNIKKKMLLDNGIEARDLYFMEDEALRNIYFLTMNDIECILESKLKWNVEKEWADFAESDMNLVTIGQPEYPEKLLNIHNSPYALFFAGKLPNPEKKSIAIVGARGRSTYGCEVTQKLSHELAACGFNIISGMARGIDRDAHIGALNAKGKTYAVLGSGVDVCYPKENRFVYDKLKECGGVISELPPKSEPKQMNFPLRNRIISGLSDIVIVVEARKKSGSLITADFALEQGKDIYVIPGRITDPLSTGCNRLLKQGAGVIYDIGEFVEDITMTKLTECTQIDFKKNLLDKKESLVYSLLDFCPTSIGSLLDNVPFELTELLDIITSLVNKGFVKECAVNNYTRAL